MKHEFERRLTPTVLSGPVRFVVNLTLRDEPGLALYCVEEIESVEGFHVDQVLAFSEGGVAVLSFVVLGRGGESHESLKKRVASIIDRHGQESAVVQPGPSREDDSTQWRLTVRAQRTKGLLRELMRILRQCDASVFRYEVVTESFHDVQVAAHRLRMNVPEGRSDILRAAIEESAPRLMIGWYEFAPFVLSLD